MVEGFNRRTWMMFMVAALPAIGSAAALANVNREPRIIRPPDDRADYHATTAALKAIGDSVAAQIDRNSLTENGDGTFTLNASTLGEDNNPLCAGERFGDQPTAASCTATLVAPDILITAGHCLDEDGTRVDLNTIYFVFDYAVKQEGVNPATFTADQVYTASEVIALANVANTADDWAVVRLSRAATGRAAVGVRSSGEIATGDSVVAIGFGAGLPMKFSDNATVQTLVEFGFEADFDIIGGNSGGPIVNPATGLVEGVLSADQGIDDFLEDGDCFRATVCPQDPGCDASFTLLASVMNAPFQTAIQNAIGGSGGGDDDNGNDDGDDNGSDDDGDDNGGDDDGSDDDGDDDGDDDSSDDDEDGDGVFDDDDVCLGTDSGAEVDDDGCGPDDILELGDDGQSICGAIGLIPPIFMFLGLTQLRRRE